jgi:hypothetical protein
MAFLDLKENSEREETVFERIFLPIVEYPPYIPPLPRGEYKGGEAKAPQGGTTENERKDSLFPLSQVLNHEEMNIC